MSDPKNSPNQFDRYRVIYPDTELNYDGQKMTVQGAALKTGFKLQPCETRKEIWTELTQEEEKALKNITKLIRKCTTDQKCSPTSNEADKTIRRKEIVGNVTNHLDSNRFEAELIHSSNGRVDGVIISSSKQILLLDSRSSNHSGKADDAFFSNLQTTCQFVAQNKAFRDILIETREQHEIVLQAKKGVKHNKGTSDTMLDQNFDINTEQVETIEAAAQLLHEQYGKGNMPADSDFVKDMSKGITQLPDNVVGYMADFGCKKSDSSIKDDKEARNLVKIACQTEKKLRENKVPKKERLTKVSTAIQQEVNKNLQPPEIVQAPSIPGQEQTNTSSDLGIPQAAPTIPVPGQPTLPQTSNSISPLAVNKNQGR